MTLLDRIGRLLASVLVAAILAGPAMAASREEMLAPLCGDDFGAQKAALEAIARAGVEGSDTEAAWSLQIVAAFDGRKLRCAGPVAYLEAADGLIAASTLQPAEGADPASLSKPSVNLRLRAFSASATAVLTLRSAPDPAQRRAALETLAKRGEAVTPQMMGALAAAETDAALQADILAMQASMQLGNADPALRLAAVEEIGKTASKANASLLAEALAKEQDPQVAAAIKTQIAGIERVLSFGRLLTTLYSGMSYASVLFLAALGLAVIFGLMGVINLAQGELIMIGAYAGWLVQEAMRALVPGLLDYYLIVAIPISFLASALVGLAMEALIIRRLYTRPLMTLLATWAISLLLINTVRVVFGSQNMEFYQPAYVSGGVQVLGDFIMTMNRLFAILISVGACLVVLWLLRRTTFGLYLRAVTQNRAIAGALGINTRRIDQLAFGLGSGLAGLAGLALSPLYNVNPNMGANFVVDSFMVVVLGGVGSLLGAVLAALGIGQINVVIEPLYGAVAAKVLVLLLIIAFIQWRPEGLFAPKGRR